MGRVNFFACWAIMCFVWLHTFMSKHVWIDYTLRGIYVVNSRASESILYEFFLIFPTFPTLVWRGLALMLGRCTWFRWLRQTVHNFLNIFRFANNKFIHLGSCGFHVQLCAVAITSEPVTALWCHIFESQFILNTQFKHSHSISNIFTNKKIFIYSIYL